MQFKAQVPGSVARLRRTVMPILDDFTVVSFDIFDTLVERVIEPPDQVKRLAARHLSEILTARGDLEITVEEMVELRDEVEADLRHRSALAGLDSECRFTELAEGMAERLAVRSIVVPPCKNDINSLRNTIISSELAAETLALRAKDGMPELLADIKAAGKRIIAISDMYLDGSLIRDLLDRLGIGRHIDELYASSDHACGKHSGRLFLHVFKQESIAPAAILHIGDNPISDFAIPLSAGSSAILFLHPDQPRRQQVNQAYKWLSKRNPYWRGRHLFAGIPAAKGNDFFFTYGFDILGPIYATFVARVREELIANGIEHAYFLARDGELFYRLHGFLDNPALCLPPAPGNTYLHISRKAVALPAARDGLSVRQLEMLLPRMQKRGLAAITDALGIEAEALNDIVHRLQLTGASTPLDVASRDWPKLLAADASLQELVRQRSGDARAMLRRYLEQQGFFGAGHRIALVDVGWNGSIQRGLKDAFGRDDDWPQVSGYYLSFNDNLGHGLHADEATGMLFDKHRMHPRYSIFEHFEEVFENGARALDGTTIGYEELADRTVAPVLLADEANDRRAERDFDPLAARLREGALAFMEHFAARYALSGYRSRDLQPFVLELAHRAVFYPSREETEQLFRIVHAEDAGTGSVLDFSTYRLSGPWLLTRPLRLLQLLRQSNWKYGSGRSLGVPGFNHLLRLAHLLLIARDWRRNRAIPPSRIAWPRLWEKLVLKAVERGGLPALLRFRNMARRKE